MKLPSFATLVAIAALALPPPATADTVVCTGGGIGTVDFAISPTLTTTPADHDWTVIALTGTNFCYSLDAEPNMTVEMRITGQGLGSCKAITFSAQIGGFTAEIIVDPVGTTLPTTTSIAEGEFYLGFGRIGFLGNITSGRYEGHRVLLNGTQPLLDSRCITGNATAFQGTLNQIVISK
jgi:hypothetical protein